MTDHLSHVSTVTSQNTTISIEEFMRIFVDQLKYQDPLNPVDNKEFLAQIAQFTSLQIEQEALSETRSIADTLEWVNASQFMGRNVEARAANGFISGVVERVRVQGSRLVMDIRSSEGDMFTGIAMGDVISLGSASDVD